MADQALAQDPAPEGWLVACLCAAWCRTCDDYRHTFDRLAGEFGAAARFLWVDIEDEAQALGAVDVVDFPTLLLAQGERIAFFGPVMPHLQTARQLLDRALQGKLEASVHASLDGLPARLRALP
jgi:thiol-disulfide isomerase/thioredoxin